MYIWQVGWCMYVGSPADTLTLWHASPCHNTALLFDINLHNGRYDITHEDGLLGRPFATSVLMTYCGCFEGRHGQRRTVGRRL